MGKSTTHVAVDVGTSSGTCALGTVGLDELHVREVHRFESGLLDDTNRRAWNVDRLVGDIFAGLERAFAEVDTIESVGIDATAGGFGFLADGTLLRNPAREGVARPPGISHRQTFFETGHRRLPLTYYYQFRERPELVERADTLLLAPQLLAYHLGGEPAGELTYAISSGLGNTRTGTWATSVLDTWGLRTDLLPPMRPHGEAFGTISPPDDASGGGPLPMAPHIRSVPGHDTSAAVAAIPFSDGESAFLATGSYFIPGFEVSSPIITDAAFEMKAENMGGVAGTSRFVRNLPGFSILERFRREWATAGGLVAYDELIDAARASPAFRTLVATTDERIRPGGSHVSVTDGLGDYCKATGQPVPESEGAITRCLLESLAAESAVMIDRLAELSGYTATELRLVGGGAKNALLCEFVADALDRPVLAGAPEATAIGNVLSQAIGAGSIASINDARKLVDRHVAFDRYETSDSTDWVPVKERIRELME